MARILVIYLKYLGFISLFLPLPSWTRISCWEWHAPTCNYTLMFERSGIPESMVCKIAKSNAETCVLPKEIYGRHHHTTIRCLKNAPRIVFDGHSHLKTRRFAIKNCVMYWKDMLNMLGMTEVSITKLILDDWKDEYVAEDSDYLQQRVSKICSQPFRNGILNFPMRVYLLSSVARPLSEAFWSYSLQVVKELYIKG